jgi:molybdopterin/thiamine biosynthesis adenylyltransferase
MSELSRYARQIVLPGVGVNGQQLLLDSSALIVGLGGLGSLASLYLAGAGIGKLVIIDRDRVDASNLQRQILYTQSDLGRPKAMAAQERLAALNPTIDIQAIDADALDDALAQRVGEADIVLDCSDNFPLRFALNAACVARRRPLVSAAAIRFEAQVALFDAARGGPCYRCLYADSGETQERCEDAGVLGPMVGMAASLQALIALRQLLGIGADLGRLHLWNASTLSWRNLGLSADPGCPVCGRCADSALSPS